jgi:hypothetical protein
VARLRLRPLYSERGVGQPERTARTKTLGTKFNTHLIDYSANLVLFVPCYKVFVPCFALVTFYHRYARGRAGARVHARVHVMENH